MSTPRIPLPDSYEGILNRAQFAARTGEAEAAIDLYRRLVEKLGRLSDRILARRSDLRDLHLQARLELVDLLRLEGRFAEAIEVAEGLLKTHPEQANIWRRDVAVLRSSKGEVDRGISELKALADEDPEDVWTWLVLGNEARIEGRFSESQAALARALEAAKQKDDPKITANIHYGRFRLFEATGQVDQAVAAWEEAVSAEPEVGRTVREVVTLLTDAGRYTDAQRFVARDENKLQAGFQRGVLADLAGDAAKARKEWQAVASMDPAELEYGQDCWVEAVLRLADPAPALQRLPQLLRQHGSVRLLILSGIAWAMHGNRERAQALFQETIGLLRRARPPKQKLDSADWRLLNALVSDAEMKTTLKPYFAVLETIWG